VEKLESPAAEYFGEAPVYHTRKKCLKIQECIIMGEGHSLNRFLRKTCLKKTYLLEKNGDS